MVFFFTSLQPMYGQTQIDYYRLLDSYVDSERGDENEAANLLFESRLLIKREIDRVSRKLENKDFAKIRDFEVKQWDILESKIRFYPNKRTFIKSGGIKHIRYYINSTLELLEEMVTKNSVSCYTLLNHVLDNGVPLASIDEVELNSSYLRKVSLYDVRGHSIVIAKMTNDDNYIKDYIFCDFPYDNWKLFETPTKLRISTYGERFWDYIKPYRCNCD